MSVWGDIDGWDGLVEGAGDYGLTPAVSIQATQPNTGNTTFVSVAGSVLIVEDAIGFVNDAEVIISSSVAGQANDYWLGGGVQGFYIQVTDESAEYTVDYTFSSTLTGESLSLQLPGQGSSRDYAATSGSFTGAIPVGKHLFYWSSSVAAHGPQLQDASVRLEVDSLNSIWDAPVSGSFEQPGRWVREKAPEAKRRLIFDKAGEYAVQLSSSPTVRALELRNGWVTFEMNGNTLSATEHVSVRSGGHLILKQGNAQAQQVTVAGRLELAGDAGVTAGQYHQQPGSTLAIAFDGQAKQARLQAQSASLDGELRVELTDTREATTYRLLESSGSLIGEFHNGKTPENTQPRLYRNAKVTVDTTTGDRDFAINYYRSADADGPARVELRAPQKVYLAYSESAPYSFEIQRVAGFDIPIPSSTPSPASQRVQGIAAALKAEVQAIYRNAGIDNIDFVNQPSDDAAVVYFTDKMHAASVYGKAGTGIGDSGIDTFNRSPGGTAIVWVTGESTVDIPVTAHELGHLFGLRHLANQDDYVVGASIYNQPDRVEYSLATHNPVYHLERYVDGTPAQTLSENGFEAGSYDEAGGLLRELKAVIGLGGGGGDGAAQTPAAAFQLFGTRVFLTPSDEATSYQYAFLGDITLDALNGYSIDLIEGESLQIIAASTPDGPFDIVLSVGQLEEGLFVPAALGEHGFTLIQLLGGGSHLELASGKLSVTVPEPSLGGLLAGALLGLGVRKRR